MKRFLNWLSDKFQSEIAAMCWLAHGKHWRYVRHAGEVDTDVGEYLCDRCGATRLKREWL